MAFTDPEKDKAYHREYYHRVRKKSILTPAQKMSENLKHLDELPVTEDGKRFLFYWEIPGFYDSLI